MKYVVFYHDNCPDGFTCAWLLNKMFTTHAAHSHAQVDFVGCSHGDDDFNYDVTDAHVWVVDFSFSHNVWTKIFDTCATLTVVDHHETAQKFFSSFTDWSQLSSKINDTNFIYETDIHRFIDSSIGKTYAVLIDQTHCAAQLLSMYFDEQSDFIDYIEDRDLFNNSLPRSREVSAYVNSFPKTFDVWDQLDDTPIEEMISLGAPIVAYREQMISAVVNQAIPMKLYGYDVLGASCNHFLGTDVAHRLAQQSPSKIGVYWYDISTTRRKYGLRSLDDGPNVAEIANYFDPKGGGHTHASGFSAHIDLDITKPVLCDMTGERLNHVFEIGHATGNVKDSLHMTLRSGWGEFEDFGEVEFILGPAAIKTLLDTFPPIAKAIYSSYARWL